jgi:hypothetical protein
MAFRRPRFPVAVSGGGGVCATNVDTAIPANRMKAAIRFMKRLSLFDS